MPDTPDNYHTITVMLADAGDHADVSLSQDNNSTGEERDNSAATWAMMLGTLKSVLEA